MPPIDSSHLAHEKPIAGVLNKPTLRANRSMSYADIRLHVSDLIKSNADTKFCNREFLIKKLFNPVIIAAPLSAAFDLLFALGNSLHDNARNRWMRYDLYGDRRVLARWACPCGNLQHHGVNPRKYMCDNCGHAPMQFDEYEILDRELNIVAHPDFTVVRGKSVIDSGVFDKSKHVVRIVEIKGIDRIDLDWDTLDAPLGEHTLQGSMYYYLMKRAGYKVDPKISYLYGERAVKKSLFRGNPWKEFELEASEYPRVKKIFDKAYEIKEFVAERKIPERSVCANDKCPRAKNCPVSYICFGIPKDEHKIETSHKVKARPGSPVRKSGPLIAPDIRSD